MQWKRKDSFCYLFTEHKLESNNTEILNIILSSLLTHLASSYQNQSHTTSTLSQISTTGLFIDPE